jgi:hypothetical protein
MLSPSDLISLPYTPDLTRAGIAYACRSLPHTYDRMGGSPFNRMRRIAAGKAVELAFRRHLGKEGVPYDTLGATPFTDPDRYDVALGGRRCDLKSFQIFAKDRILQARRDPEFWLNASALVPTDQLVSDHLNDNDLYIFAFFTALVTQNQDDLKRAMAAGQPIYLIHPLPEAWARPETWLSLGPLALKTDLPEAVTIEIGGQDGNRGFQTETISLPPRTRRKPKKDYFSLAYLNLPQTPEGRVGIFSPRLKETYIVPPEAWENIWIYGIDIILAGYLTRGEFRRRARDLPPNSRVEQYARTRTRNGALPIRQLRPLADLFERAKEWERYKNVMRDA